MEKVRVRVHRGPGAHRRSRGRAGLAWPASRNYNIAGVNTLTAIENDTPAGPRI
jgi:hypothetical protein